MPTDDITKATRQWVETFVIGLNLCPFAKRELIHDRIRFQATEAESAVDLIPILKAELEKIRDDNSVGTTLIIHPKALIDFHAYLDFIQVAENLVVDLDLEGEIQIASFHPDYQFAGTDKGDASNYTNRSPYPMLHLIREADIERAVEQHPDVESIPERNIALMHEMGIDTLKLLLGAH